MECSRFSKIAGPEMKSAHRAPAGLPPAFPPVAKGVRGRVGDAIQDRGARFSTVAIYEGRKAA